MRKRVIITDFPWNELSVERQMFDEAGFDLMAGPSNAGDAGAIEALVAAADPDAIMTCWAPVNDAAIAAAPRARIIARLGVGLDNIATQAAARRGMWVTNVPDYCTEEVADHALALALAHFRGVAKLDRATKAHGWRNPQISLRRISELTFGLVGFGRIGRATAARVRGFGARVLAYSRTLSSGEGVEAVSLARIQAEADIIILQLPLTAESAGMVDAAFLRACLKKPLLVNVGRGGLVDNNALVDALDAGFVSGAALDVVDGEPEPPRDLLAREDVVVTPHIAYLSLESLTELRRRACDDVVRALNGARPLNVCVEAQ